MAATLKRHLEVEATLTIGTGGEFTIWVDGAKVFDKRQAGGFPTDDQAVAAVRASISPSSPASAR